MRTAQGVSDFYQNMGHSAEAIQANPHQLVSMLLKQARKKIALAQEASQHDDLVRKSQSIHRACSIVDALRLSLDTDAGGEIASNLEDLYDYLYRRLLQVTAMDDPTGLDEADSLLATIQDAWDSIDPTADQVVAEN